MVAERRAREDARILHPASAAMPSTATHDAAAEITSLNPVPWSRRAGCDQGQLRTGVQTIVTIGGQRPVNADGQLLHEGDMAAQLALALDNLTEVMLEAGMAFRDLAHLRIYTTDMAALSDVGLVLFEHLAAHGATTPVTTIEVSGLAIAGMAVEIDGLAALTAPPTGTSSL